MQRVDKIQHLFSLLGKLADRAIYFTFRNFFLFISFFLLWAKLSEYLLDRFWRSFHQMKVFAWIFLIRSSFSASSRDVAMATNFVSYQTFRSEPKYLRIRWTIFTIFALVGTELQMINPIFFFRYLKGRCHSNQLKSKNRRFLRTNLLFQ